jgi:[NiFe] hydrogenase diaphorase moiety small subunit
MESVVKFKIDGREVVGRAGQTILEVATANGVYIPHLCAHPELTPWGSCRVCLVKVNGRLQPACIQPATAGALIENDTAELNELRRALVEMLFIEGNHICPSCERSGNCELQAMAYRLGITVPRYPFKFASRERDMSHPDIMLDRDRCILCARCVRASQELDHKHVFDFVGRGSHKCIAVDSDGELCNTDAKATDRALEVCPVGCLVKKHVGFSVPVGRRRYDRQPIGSQLQNDPRK